MRKYLLAALMGLLIGTVAFAADVRRSISVGDINFGSGTFTDTVGLVLHKVNADNVPFSQDNDVKVGDLYYFALAADNGVNGYALLSAGDNTFYWGAISGAIDWSAVAITGGTIDNTPIGGTTASTGAFSTLSATSFTLGDVSNTEFGYLNGVISSVQGQIDGKQTGSSFLSNISDGVLTTLLNITDDIALSFGTDNDFHVRYKSADGTLVISAADNTAYCTLTKSGGLTCTEITADVIGSTCSPTDNECIINAANTGLPLTGMSPGDCLFDNTNNLWSCRNSDNNAWITGGSGSTTTLPWDNITSRPTINSVTVTGAVLDNAANYPTLNQNTTGNAATATALAADPADCAAGQIATGIAASGALSCTATPSVTTITGALSGNASTATALAANGSNCSAGQSPLGVDASGAVEGCWTPAQMTYPGAGIPNSTGSAWGTSYTLDTDLSSVSGSDDTIPSAKATKAALDDKIADSTVWTRSFTIYNYSASYDNVVAMMFHTAATVTRLDCHTGGADTVVVTAYECDSSSASCSTTGLSVTAASTNASDTSASNGSIDATDRVMFSLTSLSGTPTYLQCDIGYTVP